MDYWSRKAELKAIAAVHTVKMNMDFPSQIERSITHTGVFDAKAPWQTGYVRNEVEIEFMKEDSVSAMFRFHPLKKVAVLNFASFNFPGGKFMEGSSAQEESLCHHSFLYNVLQRIPDFYSENAKLKNKGLYSDRALYTPNVRFFNADGRVRNTDVITCAAPNKSLLYKYGNFTEEENSMALRRRIALIADIVNAHHATPLDVLILGAFGCGVFKQDTEEVARVMFETFSMSAAQKIVYAIPDDENFNTFLKVWESYSKRGR